MSILENAGLEHPRARVDKVYLIPVVYKKLIDLAENWDEPNLRKNGFVGFPMMKWDGMLWLLKCSTLWKYQAQFKTLSITTEAGHLAEKFLKSYLERLEITEIVRIDFETGDEITDLPGWSEKFDRLGKLDWQYGFYYLNNVGKCCQFLSPRIEFERTNDKYQKANNLASDKLRTHVGVLVNGIHGLTTNAIPYGFTIENQETIKLHLENAVTEYIELHQRDKPEDGIIDLFDLSHSWDFDKEGSQLLREVMRLLSSFQDKNKEKVIQSILASEDVLKTLAAAEDLASEGLKLKLIEGIRQADIRAFLKTKFWAPEIIQTLVLIRQYAELRPLIEDVLQYWQNETKVNDNRFTHEIFQTKLLLAYYDKSEDELNNIELPTDHSSPSELSARGYNDFFLALIFTDKDPEKAIELYTSLIRQFSQYTVFAMNRMAARIKLAKSINSNEPYQVALEEWDLYVENRKERENPVSTLNLDSIFWANKLHILKELEKHELIDKEYGELTKRIQMAPDVLSAKVTSLVERKFISEAQVLLVEARDYHAFTEDDDFIIELNQTIEGKTDIEKLKNQYDRIFNNPPTTLIQIFPPKLNGKKEIHEFLVKEFGRAASQMLDKVKALLKIADENEYNDFVQLILESRISSWGWSVRDQSRTASSESDKGLGEIDLQVKDANSDHLITCEAFIWRDKTRTESHLYKLISHYTQYRKAFLVLVYFLGRQKNFESKWKEYSEEIVPNIEYPEDHGMVENSLQNVTDEFGFTQTGIRIGKAELENGSMIYHIFVNIDYQLGFWKKLKAKVSMVK